MKIVYKQYEINKDIIVSDKDIIVSELNISSVLPMEFT